VFKIVSDCSTDVSKTTIAPKSEKNITSGEIVYGSAFLRDMMKNKKNITNYEVYTLIGEKISSTTGGAISQIGIENEKRNRSNQVYFVKYVRNGSNTNE
jgi:hypothetical protein